MNLKRDNDESVAIYLLGFSPQTSGIAQDKSITLLPSVERQGIEGIDCWFVRVPRTEFEGPEAEKNLSNLDWLSPRVMAHQEAVSYLSSEFPFYPARFGTLFSSFGKLDHLVRQHRATLLRFFSEDARYVEWGIKWFVAWPQAVASFQQRVENTPREPAGEGLNYLRKQKMIRNRDQAVRDWLATELESTRKEIESLCERCREIPVRVAVAEGDWECVMNLAVLIPRQKESTLREWTDAKNVERQGIQQGQLTGPWPLYSFAPPLPDSEERQDTAAA